MVVLGVYRHRIRSGWYTCVDAPRAPRIQVRADAAAEGLGPERSRPEEKDDWLWRTRRGALPETAMDGMTGPLVMPNSAGPLRWAVASLLMDSSQAAVQALQDERARRRTARFTDRLSRTVGAW